MDRNMKKLHVGLMAHVDAGKTTLTEQLLYQTGAVRKIGRVDEGTTHTDFLLVERQRGISVRSVSVTLDYEDMRLFLLDLQGHVDFISEVERALQVLDVAILMISAVDGITPQTEFLYQALCKANVQIVLFVNKIDQIGSRTQGVLEEIKEKFSNNSIFFTNLTNENTRECCVNLVNLKNDEDQERIWEEIAVCRDEWTEAYFEGTSPQPEELNSYIQAAWNDHEMLPVLAGSALLGCGVTELLSFIKAYAFPRTYEPSLSGIVYRIAHDKIMGKMAYVRLYGGRLQNRDMIGSDKIVQIRQYTGERFVDIGYMEAGDSAVLCGLSEAYVGMPIGTLPAHYQVTKLAQPLLRSKVLLEKSEDIAPVMAAFQELTEEDPLLSMEYDPGVDEISICITGTIQLEILEALVAERFGLSVKFAPPSVIYLETPSGHGRGMDAYTMPKPCWAIVDLEVDPLPRGSGLHFEAHVPNDQMLYRYQKHVEESVPRTLKQGLYGWQVVDLSVKLVDGSYHPVHTHPLDFFLCTPMALMKALKDAGTTLLEPRMWMKISVPADFVGKVIGQLMDMRAEYDSPLIQDDWATFEIIVPVATSMDYHVRLASMTGGRAVVSSRFYDYHECPLALGAIRQRKGVDPLDRPKWILNQRGAIQGTAM